MPDAVDIARIAAVAIPVAVGLYALRRPPFQRFGALLVATGAVFVVITLSLSRDAVPYSSGRVTAWIAEAGIVYLVLAFPSGRLVTRVDRALVGAAILVVALLYLPTALLVHRYPAPAAWVTCGSHCPHNAFMLPAHEPGVVEQVVRPLREVLVIGLFLVVIGCLAQRIRGATTLARRTLTPVLVAAIARELLLAGALSVRRIAPGSALVEPLTWLLALSIPAIAVGFLIGLVRWWAYVGASLRRLAGRLRAPIRPEALRDALADAFEDPSLEIAYRIGGGRWVDARGRAVVPPEPLSSRSVTDVTLGNDIVAALFHDTALGGEQAFVDAAGSYAALTLEVHRLAASTAVVLDELEEARAQVESIAQSERKRLARDLHDGAQQRLLALRIRLDLAAERLRGKDHGAAELLRELGGQVDVALDEVRSLARGAPPDVLAAEGLAAALADSARDAPITTTIHAAGQRRFAPAIENAAYFFCSEALQNAYKHAHGATEVWVTLAARDRTLRIEVSDDGEGFDPNARRATGGLASMRDRIAAVGGHTAVVAEPGGGTRVSATIGLEPAAVPVPEA